MTSSFFFLQAEKNHANQTFIEGVERTASADADQIYIVTKPLGDSRYSYSYDGAVVVLSPRRKIAFVDFGGDVAAFHDYVEDFLEDLASISDKYRYKEAIGRPRSWRASILSMFGTKKRRSTILVSNGLLSFLFLC